MSEQGNFNIEDVDSNNFINRVIQESKTKPVVVDFWAPWCNPCKQLTPLLESAIRSAAGKINLVKINIDENQALAQQLRIQSVPTVLAFFDGKPVNGFTGLKSNDEILNFFKELVDIGEHSSEDIQNINNLIDEAETKLENKEYQSALDVFSSLLGASLPKKEMIKALAGLGKCYLNLDKFDELDELLDQLEDDIRNSDEIKDLIKSKTYLKGIEPQNIAILEEKLKENEDDLEIRFELARCLITEKRYEEAVNYLLFIIDKNKNWNQGEAKKELLELFSLLGNNNKITAEGRLKLSNLIFK
ncbi:MAG: hypothetical protein CMP40_02400 [Rickettsiales bacterium]|nr:hypothetical protein [Rickettsiales bacterium]